MEMKIITCPKCLSPVKMEDQFLFSCTRCDFRYYVNPKPCTAALIVNESRLLLVKRAIKPKKGYWDLPGGFIDPKETGEEGMVRELKEELGLALTPKDLTYLGSFPDIYEYTGITYHTLSLAYAVKAEEDKSLISQDDISSYHWFDFKDIPWESLAFKSMITAIKDLIDRQLPSPHSK